MNRATTIVVASFMRLSYVDAVVETAGLTKVFRDFWHRDKVRAVDDLNLTVRRGEVFGLLGPNGSGKTTTIKLLLGLLFPTSGMVRVFGLSSRNISVKSRIGFLPEESYLYKYLNANETMDFYGRLFGLTGRERKSRTEKLLKMSGLMPSRSRPVGEYSKGMARRIGLAQALINDPDLVIMDEPTSGLDPIGRQEVKQLVLELKKLGKTVLISSHLLADVEDVCDRIAILYAGRLIAEGSIKELLTKKDVTNVSVSGIPRSAVEKAVNALRGESARVDVSTSMGSLEEFFLSTIRGLESAEKQKSPVEQVEIASQDEKQSVIERLTT